MFSIHQTFFLWKNRIDIVKRRRDKKEESEKTAERKKLQNSLFSFS